MKNIVVIGGGTGTFTVLSGLKKYPLFLTAIVSMADSGGSNRIIRDEFGLLPTSDIRQCLVALANLPDKDDIWRKLFTYRFDKGVGISGMTFGNLFMAALTDIYGSQKKAIEKTCRILNIKGEILPVSYDDVHLVATYEDGTKVIGEHFIDEPKKKKIANQQIVALETIPQAYASKEAISAIKNADLIILGPGDLYTSVIANLVVSGVPEAIRDSKAKVLYIVNLMTKLGQTQKFGAKEHIEEIEKYLNKNSKFQIPNSKQIKNSKSQIPNRLKKLKRRIDYVLVNNGKIPEKILQRYYKFERAEAVKDNLKDNIGYKIIRTDLLSPNLYKPAKSDLLKRSLIRHDPGKLAKVIVSLI